ncbi:MAG: hypothetical protein ACI8QH_000107 [Flammeovirgaceae bacterium]|jgi:hypothetical protein
MLDFQTRVKLEVDQENLTVQIAFQPEFSQTTYDIFDLHGRTLKCGEIDSVETSLKLSGFENGQYIVLILDGNRVHSEKFQLG